MLIFNDCLFSIRYNLRERKPTGIYNKKSYRKQTDRTALRHAATGEVQLFTSFAHAVEAASNFVECFKDCDQEVVKPTIQSHTRLRKGFEL